MAQTGELDFVAFPTQDFAKRNYVLSCEHAETVLTRDMQGSTDAVTGRDDGEVLSNLIETHRLHVVEGGGLCLCQPTGDWKRQA